MPVTKHLLLLLLFVFHPCLADTSETSCSNIKLQILGAGGPEINDGLASSSYLVWIGNKARIMIDAGGGSSLNFEKSGADFNDLQAILLTHLHVDHSVEIPVYLKAGYFSGREDNLALFGPAAGGDFPSTSDFTKALISDQQASVYPYLSDNLYQQTSTDFLIVPHDVDADSEPWQYKINNRLSIRATRVTHGRIPALAWRVEYGSCSITFSGDMNGTSGNLPSLAENTDILVAHNAIPQHASTVAKKLHMTPMKIGEIAQQAHVKKLVLSHFMLRTVNRKHESRQLIRKNYRGEIIDATALMFIKPRNHR